MHSPKIHDSRALLSFVVQSSNTIYAPWGRGTGGGGKIPLGHGFGGKGQLVKHMLLLWENWSLGRHMLQKHGYPPHMK